MGKLNELTWNMCECKSEGMPTTYFAISDFLCVNRKLMTNHCMDTMHCPVSFVTSGVLLLHHRRERIRRRFFAKFLATFKILKVIILRSTSTRRMVVGVHQIMAHHHQHMYLFNICQSLQQCPNPLSSSIN